LIGEDMSNELDAIAWQSCAGENSLSKSYLIEIPYNLFAEWASARAKSSKIDGFRPGKAPMSEFKEEWLKNVRMYFAKKIATQEKFEKLYDVTNNTACFDPNNDIKLELCFEFYPTIPQIDFANIRLAKRVVEIADQDVSNSIDNWSKTHFFPVELNETRGIRIYDFITLSVQQNGLVEKDRVYQIGVKALKQGIEDLLIDKHVNETIKIPPIEIRVVDIKAGRNYDVQSMIEAFNVKSEDELKIKFCDALIKEAEQYSQYLLKKDLIQELSKIIFDVPVAILNSMRDIVRERCLSDIGYHQHNKNCNADCLSASIEDLIKEKLGMNIEEFEKRVASNAAEQARLSILFRYYANQLCVNITDDELSDAIQKQSKYFNDNEKEAVQFFRENKRAKDELYGNLLEEKVTDRLLQMCSVDNLNISFQSLINP
jgi:trigger factor